MEKQYLRLPVDELIPYENNPRINDEAAEAVAKSIEQCGYIAPIITDEDMVILGGHTRVKAMQQLGIKECEVLVVSGLTDEQKRKYRLLDNKTAELAEWDWEMLENELFDLDFGDLELDWFDGFEEEVGGLDDVEDVEEDTEAVGLKESFGVSPFTVWDGRSGEWSERKNEWLQIGIDSGNGRGTNLITSTKNPEWATVKTDGAAPMTSIFDPVVCELSYKWFCVDGGKILDPFAGGSVRGVVAEVLGYSYFGNDLREEQIEENVANATKILGENIPVWTCGDSCDIDKLLPGEYDMIFSCPPYFDLEVYSDDDRDISNMEYEDFIEKYRMIIKKSCEMLKENRFAVFVVGEIRDKKGFYRGL